MNNRVRYINTDIFKGVYQPIRTKNAYAIGFIGKSSYIVTLEKDDENKNKMKIHTYINDKGEKEIRYIEEEITVSQSKIDKRLCEEWSLPKNY